MKLPHRLLVLFSCLCILPSAFATSVVTIATGSNVGLYYPSGSAICRLLNLTSKNGVRCIVESTPGSSYNLNAVEGGMNNFAFVQADELLSYAEKKKQEGHPSTVQVVFPLYTEAFVLVVSSQSGIQNLEDIKGKSINIGAEGSGVRNFTTKIVENLSLKSTDFKNIISETQPNAKQMLCSGNIDASLFVAGQPSETIQHLVENCGAKIIPFPQSLINNIISQNPYYSLVKIPSEMYFGHAFEIQTIGTKAVLVTSNVTDSETVYNLTNTIVSNFETFKRYSPVTSRMSVEEINSSLPFLQFHPSAIKAFEENGLKK